MPIERVPVVHKFGIISHSQRLQLQERLLKQSYLNSIQTRRPPTTRIQFEVGEEFVTQYNNAHGLEEQEKLEDQAHKMLQRIKRKCGLKGGGFGQHVDLPVAWTELAQLAQCKGHIQEDCLDIMITSLDQAPLAKSHIAALFYLAETTLYWLRTEAIHQPYLRTGEIKLLRMGQLVFMRLFYHHMSGQLQSHSEFKNRLFTYLDGFGECQSAYNPYPNALLCLRYINEVGKMIIGDCNIDAGEIKEGDNVMTSMNAETETFTSRSTVTQISDQRTASRMSVIQRLYQGEASNIQAMQEEEQEQQSSHSGAISSSVHDLSPTLWHGLDVWRCVKHLSGGHMEALRSLGNCGMGLASESWMDVLVAVHILGDAAKASCSTLRTLQNLARGIRPKTPSPSPVHNDYEPRTSSNDMTTAESSKHSDARTQKFALSDIYEKTEENLSSSNPGSSYDDSTQEQPSENIVQLDKKGCNQGSSMLEEQSSRKDIHPESQDREKTDTGPPNTGNKADAGTDLPSGRASEASSVPTYTNLAHPEIPGLHGWHWEVAVTYCDLMADICLHGSTSNIRKLALVGDNKDVSQIHKKAFRPEVPISSAGLLDLVYFRASQETKDKSPNDWSWRVRYSAVHGVVKVCRCCAGDPTKEGIRTVAWNALLKAHSLEKDLRVQEALKVGQVDVNIEKLLREHLDVAPSTIGAKIAAGLAKLYLPALPPPIVPSSTPRKATKQIIMSHPVSKKPQRTSLKQEIQLATALYEQPVPFNTRGDFDLRRVVEDQWRKDLQKQQLDEEEERQRELRANQEKREAKQKEVEAKRKEKLKNKYQGPAYHVPGVTKHETQEGTSISNKSLKA